MLLINRTHKCRCGWQHLVDKDEDSLLRSELDTLANNVDELAYSKILQIVIDHKLISKVETIQSDNSGHAQMGPGTSSCRSSVYLFGLLSHR